MILFGVFGGVFADVVDRRLLLLGTQSAMMLCSLGLWWLTATGHVTMPLLYAFCVLAGSATALSNPARQAMIPTLVPEAALPRARSGSACRRGSSRRCSGRPSAASSSASGAAVVYLMDAVSFVAMIVALLLMRSRGEAAPTATIGLDASPEASRFLWKTPILLGLMLADFLGTFFAGAMLLMPIFASELHVGPKVSACCSPRPPGRRPGAGRTRHRRARLAAARGSTVLLCIGLYGLSTAAFGTTRLVPLALLFLALGGAADGASAVVRQTLRQLLTPDHLRGHADRRHDDLLHGADRSSASSRPVRSRASPACGRR